jgi:hypothetical protein
MMAPNAARDLAPPEVAHGNANIVFCSFLLSRQSARTMSNGEGRLLGARNSDEVHPLQGSPPPLCSARNLMLRVFRPPFMLLSSRVGIRDANRPERRCLTLDDHAEYGDLNFVAPERLLRVRESLGPGWREGGLGCNG